MFFGTAKYDCEIKPRTMFSYLPLTNNSVTVGLSFITKHISNHIIKND